MGIEECLFHREGGYCIGEDIRGSGFYCSNMSNDDNGFAKCNGATE